jgi:hypothetical protein
MAEIKNKYFIGQEVKCHYNKIGTIPVWSSIANWIKKHWDSPFIDVYILSINSQPKETNKWCEGCNKVNTIIEGSEIVYKVIYGDEGYEFYLKESDIREAERAGD